MCDRRRIASCGAAAPMKIAACRTGSRRVRVICQAHAIDRAVILLEKDYQLACCLPARPSKASTT